MNIEDMLVEADKALFNYEIKDAKIYLESVLEMNPSNIEALIKLSKILMIQDKNEEALKYIKQTEKLDSDNVDLLFERASIFQSLNQNEEALKAYNLFLYKEPNNYFAKLNMGMIYIQQKKY